MKTNAGKYLKRPIGENEEELLEEIWNSLPPVENDDQMLDENYRNVKQRIHKHTFRRRISTFQVVQLRYAYLYFCYSAPNHPKSLLYLHN